MRLLRPVLAMSIALLVLAPAVFAVTLNEIRIDQPSTDLDEFVELKGLPGESLDDLSLIVIGDATNPNGVVEEIVPLTGFSIQPDGLFLVAETGFTMTGTPDLVVDLNLENSDNVTFMIVNNLNPAINVGTGFGGSDLDTNDDGAIDPTGDYDGDLIDDGAPWIAVVDCVAMLESVGSGDLVYCATTIGPEGSFVPGHVYVCPDGGIWVLGNYDPLLGVDTPDFANPGCTVPVSPTTWGAIKSMY